MERCGTNSIGDNYGYAGEDSGISFDSTYIVYLDCPLIFMLYTIVGP